MDDRTLAGGKWRAHIWRKLSPYLDEALDLQPEQVAPWLATIQQRDPSLAADLRLLLGEQDVLAAEGFLERGALLASQGPPFPGLVGSQVGSFRLRELIGEGGSSTVFRADRTAGEGAQTVALKLLRLGLYTTDGQRRFRREQAILAQLSHPNTARLIEAGMTDAGVPYIAMEHVMGLPITEHANARALALAPRLELFVSLCGAVEAAHASLVVHRDLKPSNVLVTDGGDLKVLDFGIAKLIDADATITEAIALTPGYAAPEQYRPGRVTTAADIYALGVILGELTTGSRLGPGASDSGDVAAWVKTSPAGLPPPRILARHLRGDLAAIIATAQAEEPARRYRSAGALADDVRRFLRGEPVAVHVASRWYCARKFISRHQGSVALTATLTVALLASLGVATWQYLVARQGAAFARGQAARALDMRNFMIEAFAGVPPLIPEHPAEIPERVATWKARANTLDRRSRIESLLDLANTLKDYGQFDRANAILVPTLNDAKAIDERDHLVFDTERLLIANDTARGAWGEARRRVDSLLAPLLAPPLLVPPSRSNTATVRLLVQSARLAIQEHDFARALHDAELAVQDSRRVGDDDLLAGALSQRTNALLALRAEADAVSFAGAAGRLTGRAATVVRTSSPR